MSDREGRPLTTAELRLARSVFGDAIDYAPVRLFRRKFAFFQPRGVVMAPMGHLHFHPHGSTWCDDFCDAGMAMQGLFIHELTHVWQSQTMGRWYLVLMRHPFASYTYTLKPGWPLRRYGLEQQAEIVRHFFLLMHGVPVAGAPGLESYRRILPFAPVFDG